MHFTRFTFLFCVMGILSSCVSTKIPNVAFVHPEHGQVSVNDPNFISDKEICAEEAYKNGVTIKGQTVFNREEAIDLWSKETVKIAQRHMNGGYHGAMAGVAVSTGNPKLANTNKDINKSAFARDLENISPEYTAAEERFETCLVESGWTRRIIDN